MLTLSYLNHYLHFRSNRKKAETLLPKTCSIGGLKHINFKLPYEDPRVSSGPDKPSPALPCPALREMFRYEVLWLQCQNDFFFFIAGGAACFSLSVEIHELGDTVERYSTVTFAPMCTTRLERNQDTNEGRGV